MKRYLIAFAVFAGLVLVGCYNSASLAVRPQIESVRTACGHRVLNVDVDPELVRARTPETALKDHLAVFFSGLKTDDFSRSDIPQGVSYTHLTGVKITISNFDGKWAVTDHSC